MALKLSAEVLSCVPKCEKAVMEQMHVKLCSGTNYSALVHEFNVNDSTVYSQ